MTADNIVPIAMILLFVAGFALWFLFEQKRKRLGI